MVDFSFDSKKRFEENLTDFLETTKSIDAEMAEVLTDHCNKLMSVVREGERDTKARTSFNEAIVATLDSLLAKDIDAEGK